MKKMSAIILTSMLLFSCAVLAQQKKVIAWRTCLQEQKKILAKVLLLFKHGVLFESDKHS